MADAIQPLGDRVVAIREEVPSKTASGLYLPDTAQEKSVVAKVTAVGPDVKQVKVGDRILYKQSSTTEVKLGADEYFILKEEDVLATV